LVKKVLIGDFWKSEAVQMIVILRKLEKQRSRDNIVMWAETQCLAAKIRPVSPGCATTNKKKI
jgi:hypothetical protein